MQEVQRIIYLQNITNQLPNEFTNLSQVTTSYILVFKSHVRVDVPIRQNIKANESGSLLKCDRLGSNDKNPWKRKEINDQDDHNIEVIVHEDL